jgi:hypothetical protein
MNVNPSSFSKYKIRRIMSPVMEAQRFSQMLAKIAHSYAVARFGINGFSPLLLEHILGTGECPWHFVGGRAHDLPATNSLHEIEHEWCSANGNIYLLIRVRLFASFGAPDYWVVTGQLSRSNARNAVTEP